MKAELRHTVRSVVEAAILGAIASTLCAAWACERGAPGHEGQPSSGAGERSVLHLGAAAPEAETSAANRASAAPAVVMPPPGVPGSGAGDAEDGSSSEDRAGTGTSVRSRREAAKALASETSGSPSPSCVKGWITPARGTALRKAALDMIRSSASERFGVVEMRYFVGPEDAEVLSPQSEIERWYVKAYSLADPERRQRWLVRRAPVGRGVDAVAPFESRGYGPRTWKRVDATDESLADPFLRPCNRTKPGGKCMGLPREVLGCLSGT